MTYFYGSLYTRCDQYIQPTFYVLYVECRATPLQVWTGPWAHRRLRLPKFLDHQLMALHLDSPVDVPRIHFCQKLSRPQGGRSKSTKNPNNHIGNRTRDLPACKQFLNKLRHCLSTALCNNLHFSHDQPKRSSSFPSCIIFPTVQDISELKTISYLNMVSNDNERYA